MSVFVVCVLDNLASLSVHHVGVCQEFKTFLIAQRLRSNGMRGHECDNMGPLARVGAPLARIVTTVVLCCKHVANLMSYSFFRSFDIFQNGRDPQTEQAVQYPSQGIREGRTCLPSDWTPWRYGVDP